MEVFNKIKGFENYSVSNFGNVMNDSTGRILKQSIDDNGYQFVCLSENGNTNTKRIHKLVADAFLPNPENKRCVDHINNDRLDNNLTNLRWVTYGQNNFNRSISSKNTSGHKGIYFNKKINKWMAYICIDGKLKSLGFFVKKEEALKARVFKAKELFGEFIHECEKIQYDIIKAKEDYEKELREIAELEKELENILRN